MGNIESIRWKDRAATQLSNDCVRLVVLRDGGHIAHLGFVDQDVDPNLLWEAPWKTLDLSSVDDLMTTQYGDEDVRAFLASYSGHALCLDYFGPPSAEERSRGLSLHGEAALHSWDAQRCKDPHGTSCRWNVALPLADLRFERQITLCDHQMAFRVRETVTSLRRSPHKFDWVQHITFGPPLLENRESILLISANEGLTSPQGYEGLSLIADNRKFTWPHAPATYGEVQVDLSIPFTTPGRGFIAGVCMDTERDFEHLVVINWKLRLGVGYIFRRRDFPWMTIWEENLARTASPWNGMTRARGMEFGTCPLPVRLQGATPLGLTSAVPNQRTILPGEQQEARYVIFIFKTPNSTEEICDLEVLHDDIVLLDSNKRPILSVPSKGCYSYLKDC